MAATAQERQDKNSEQECGVQNGCQNKKMSHKEWKKLRRKQKRKTEAISKSEAISNINLTRVNESPSDSSDPEERLRDEKQKKFKHLLFIERERLAQALFLAQKERERKEKEYLEEQQKQIKAEWEELQKKDAEEREKRESEAKIEKDRQDALLKEATVHENKDAWHNPIAPVIYHSERPVNECPFFKKTGACKYGDSCSRTHNYPDESNTVVIPGMFSHFRLDQTLIDEYDTDLTLEYEDTDLYNCFLEFYADVLPEFRSVGKITQFKVCSNCASHLRGNVYVSFERIENAEKAVIKFNGRWYAGKQLNCEYRTIHKWKSAICGLFAQKSCPKGNICNFLHVFKNPNNEFRDADFDFQYVHHNSRRSDYQHQNHHSNRRHRSRSTSGDRSRSKRDRSRRDRSRSHSRSRSSKYFPEGSRSRSRRNKDIAESRSQYTKDRSRSRYSWDRSRSNSHSRFSRSRSGSLPRSKRYSRERSKSNSDSDRPCKKSRSKHSRKSKKRKNSKTRSCSSSEIKVVDVSLNVNKKINRLFGGADSEQLDSVLYEKTNVDVSEFNSRDKIVQTKNVSELEKRQTKAKKHNHDKHLDTESE